MSDYHFKFRSGTIKQMTLAKWMDELELLCDGDEAGVFDCDEESFAAPYGSGVTPAQYLSLVDPYAVLLTKCGASAQRNEWSLLLTACN